MAPIMWSCNQVSFSYLFNFFNSNRSAYAVCTILQQRRLISKHYHPDWKRQRREKFLKVDLPDFHAVHKIMKQELSITDSKALMKMKGILPYRIHHSPLVDLSNSNKVFEPYTPTEEKSSSVNFLSKKNLQLPRKALAKRKALKEIKNFEEDFDIQLFPDLAHTIYVDVHMLLQNVFPRNFLCKHQDTTDLFKLHDLVTEYAWPLITNGLSNKTLSWRFVESLEPVKVVHVVATPHIRKDNMFAQITVRFHQKQIMAIYDRFGRLMYGSETVPKDVIEFIVFEKHLSDDQSKWRVHCRIKPSSYKFDGREILTTSKLSNEETVSK